MKHTLPSLTVTVPLERNSTQVEKGLLEMDKMYGASFTSWLRNEENVSVAASYLQPIISDYSFLQISEAIRWLEHGWKTDCTAWLLHELFQSWRVSFDSDMDYERARLIRFLMTEWSLKKQAGFITSFLDIDVLYPHGSPSRFTFLKWVFENVTFADLSQLFSLVGNSLDYASKVALLQHAAKTAPRSVSTLKRSSELYPAISMKRAKSANSLSTHLGLTSHNPNQSQPQFDTTTSFRTQLDSMLNYSSHLSPRLSRTCSVESPSSSIGLDRNLNLTYHPPTTSPSLSLDYTDSPLPSPTFLSAESIHDHHSNAKQPNLI